jgi:hypothetical protein
MVPPGFNTLKISFTNRSPGNSIDLKMGMTISTEEGSNGSLPVIIHQQMLNQDAT